jgi:uncharacterized protein
MKMKRVILRILRLFIGLFLYAVGIVLTIRASLGVSPWDVFHGGLSSSAGITMGRASILVGVVLVIIDAFLGERLGWGTLANMLFIGVFMDFLMLNNLIPVFDSVLLRMIMMLLGMLVIGIASFYYIGAGLGSGPRDGLMVALKKRTNKSVRFIRNSIEIAVLVIGYAMGGNVGFGTLIMAIGMGYFVQFAFKIFKFDVSSVKHRFIDDDIRFIKGLIISLNTKNEQEL